MGNTTPLSADKQALLELRLRGASKTPTRVRRLFKRPQGEPAPLSFSQLYIWASDQMAPGNPAHNLPVGFRIKGRLDARMLEESFNAIIRRHEVLRTTFAVNDGEPIQVIHSQLRIQLSLIELDRLPGNTGELELQKLASEESAKSFDLSRLPLIRVSLYRLGDIEHVLIFTLHHIIADGLSVGLLMHELDGLYGAFRSGNTPQLPELPAQYADFAFWQRQEFLKNSYRKQLAFWRTQMIGQLRTLALPYDRARPAVRTFRGASVFFSIPQVLAEKLNALDEKNGGTFFSVALALFQVMLNRYSGSEDMLILTPVAHRTLDETQPLIGDFLNLAPLRCDVSGNPTFIELLRGSRETTLNALSNIDLPFDKIVDGMKIERSSGQEPIFQVLLQVLPQVRSKIADLEIENFNFDLAFSQFDLSLHLYQRTDGYLGRFEYSTDVFDSGTIEKWSSNFMQMLETVAADPTQPIASIPFAVPLLVDDGLSKKSPSNPCSSDRPFGQNSYAPPRNELERSLTIAWETALDVKHIGINDSFFELGGMSLSAIKLVFELERMRGIKIGFSEIIQNPTVARMAGLVDNRRPTGTRRPKVVELRRGSLEPPVYFIYAGPDEYRLAQFMKTGHSVYGIEVPWPMHLRKAVANRGRSAYPTMEQFVAPYVTALAAHANSSACVLVGHSFAGLMAFETARQFQNQAGKVEMVILLDVQSRYADPLEAAWIKLRRTWAKQPGSGPASRHSTKVVSRLGLSLRIARWLLGVGKTRALSFVMRHLSKRATFNPASLTTLLDEQGTPVAGELVFKLYMGVQKRYRQSQLDSQGILFRSIEMADENNVNVIDGSLGWSNLFTRGLEVIPAVGDHLSMIREHYPDLARQLDEVLHRIPSGSIDK